jgi:protoporphyrinogen oxidase
MAHRNTVEYGRRIVGIEPHRKRIMLADGTSRAYDTVLATLPLNRLTALADQKLESQPDPSTAVLVLNIGGIRGPRCPAEHWLYVPDSLSGFFRVGFYSNVTTDFLPDDKETERVSLYVERAFRDGERPSEAAVRAYTTSVVEELIAWGFLDRVEVVDPTWIDVAYTWTRPGSTWRRDALAALETAGIFPVGRYARWSFQGIADSIRDGLSAGTALRSNG